MFVPVACLKCGKPFQVPEAAAGTTVNCPWCKNPTLALPVAGLPDGATAPAPAPSVPPTPAPAPAPVTTPVAPLSLDDETPLAPKAPPAPTSAPIPIAPPVAPKAPTEFPFKTAIVVLLLSAICGLGTFFAYPWVKNWLNPPPPPVDLADAPWAEFTPPDGAFTVTLPGQPIEEPLPTAIGGPGSRVIVRDENSGWSAWVGWRNLDTPWARKAITKQAWSDLRPVFEAEVQRLEQEWNGTKRRQETIKFDDPLTIEVDVDSPRGKIRERLILALDSARPRVYFVGIAARDLDPAGPHTQRLFNSFRVNKAG